MDVVGIGFIGLGNITQTRHLPAFASFGSAERRVGGGRIVAGADVNDQLLESVARKYGFKRSYEDYRELLADKEVDAVFINLPTVHHGRVAIDALNAGKHVFIEKPMAINVAEADAMVEAARRADRALMVGLNQRFARRSVLLRDAIQKGKLGKPYFLKAGMTQHNGEPPPQSWFARREMAGGGVLMDQGSSLIDLVLWLLDFPDVVSTTGSIGRHILRDAYNVEDFAALSFETANGLTAHLELAWVYNGGPYPNRLYVDVYGDKGGARNRARWSAEGHPLTLFRRAKADQVVGERVPFTPIDSHLEQDHQFIEMIRREAWREQRPEDAVRSLRVIEDVYKRNGLEPAAGSFTDPQAGGGAAPAASEPEVGAAPAGAS